MKQQLISIFAVAVVTVCILATLTTALHEDQAGKYDWVLPRVGTPTHGSLLVASNRKAAFVVTEANAVAALKLKNGAIQWRRVFGTEDELAGVAVVTLDNRGDSATVVTATRAGVIYFLRGRDGAPMTAPFSLAAEGVKIVSVFASGTEDKPTVHVVGTTGKELSLYVVEPLAQFKVSPVFHVPVPGPISGIALGTTTSAASNSNNDADAQEMLVVLEDGRSNWIKLRAGVALRPWQDGTSSLLTTSKRWRGVPISSGVALSSVISAAAGQKDANEGILISSDQVGSGAVGRSSGATSVECQSTGVISVHGVAATEIRCDPRRGVDVLAISTATASDSYRLLFNTRHDGAVHFVAVSTGKKELTTAWTSHEGLAFPIDVALESEHVFSSSASSASNASLTKKKTFGVVTAVFVLSKHSHLYKVNAGGNGVAWVTDLTKSAVVVVPATGVAGAALSVRGRGEHVVVTTSKKAEITVDAETGKIVSSATPEQVAARRFEALRLAMESSSSSSTAAASSSSKQKKDNNNKEGSNAGGAAAAPITTQHLYDLDKSTGEITGYELTSNTAAAEAPTRVDLWRIRVPGRITTVVAAGQEPLAITSVEHYKAVPNRTSATTEIRRRYPMANVIIIASHDNNDALTVSAIDALTGSTLASSRHNDAPGPVRVIVAEHSVIYHFYSRTKRRHYVAVWELFEHQLTVTLDSNIVSPALVATSLVAKRRQFHSATVRPPHVVTTLRYFPHGPVAVLGVSHTAQAIARKLVVFVLPNGEALSIALPQLWGAPLKTPDPKTEQEVMMWNSIAIGSYDRLTHTNRVMRPTLFRCAPTLLESTSRIVVAGLDLWFFPASAGKPFDRLDDEFNKRGLLGVCVGLPLAALILRWFAKRRAVNAAWS